MSKYDKVEGNKGEVWVLMILCFLCGAGCATVVCQWVN